ncbi:RNA polymerase sigma factor [Paenibacillus sp. HJGM_3]|uniref:RNA polymerase sigma factor n=1 Tax=Paenibacillus sp. HJGM_3 TaxID=3379816 RepID=UPI003863C723
MTIRECRQMRDAGGDPAERVPTGETGGGPRGRIQGRVDEKSNLKERARTNQVASCLGNQVPKCPDATRELAGRVQHARTPGLAASPASQPAGGERLQELEALRQPLLRYCLQLAGSRWDAEDLVQDTMVRLLDAAAERPERETGFRYACRTARNLWIDRWRRSQRGARLVRAEAAHSQSAPDRAAGDMDVREHLEELAWRLSPKPFVILLLMDVFDFTAKETAAWLGGTEVAVQVALSRARSRLQSLRRPAGATGRAVGSRAAERQAALSGPGSAAFFEAVLDAFRRREPVAMQEAYLSLTASGAQLQRLRSMGGKVYFTFKDPDGNLLMVTA